MCKTNVELAPPCPPLDSSAQKKENKNNSAILLRFIVTFLPCINISFPIDITEMPYKNLLESSILIATIMEDTYKNYLGVIGKIASKNLQILYDCLYMPLPPISSDEMFHLLDKLERGECIDIDTERRGLNTKCIYESYNKVDIMVNFSIRLFEKLKPKEVDPDDELYA
jgi:hypothetical protein